MLIYIIFLTAAMSTLTLADSNLPTFPSSDKCLGPYNIEGITKGRITTDASNVKRNYSTLTTCQWNIKSHPNSIIKLTFDYSITECGWDYVFVYDGLSREHSTLLGGLTGYRTYASSPSHVFNTDRENILPLYSQDILVSSSNALSVFFYSDEQITSMGFSATFQVLDIGSICVEDSECGIGGTCTNSECSCDEKHEGTFCEKITTGYKEFVPREQHSVAYDPITDKAFISFGKTFNPQGSGLILISDILVYDFTIHDNFTQNGESVPAAWSKLEHHSPTDIRPASRYSHYSFVEDGIYYIVGGVQSPKTGHTEIWAYTLETLSWKLLPTNGGPPSLENPQVVHVPSDTQGSKSKIYLYGGLGTTFSGATVDYRLFVYDLDKLKWEQKQSNGIALYGGTPIYHKETNSIYFSGGYRFQNELRVQKYSIESNYWYNIGPSSDSTTFHLENMVSRNYSSLQSVQEQRSFARGVYLGDDLLMLLGGQTPGIGGVQEFDNVCYSPYAQVFDIACQTWVQVLPKELNLLGRAGHGIFQRNDSIWIVAGSNGIFLQDMFSIPIKAVTSLLPPREELEKESCRSDHWCSYGSYYQCTDCSARPYCQWCSERCMYIGEEKSIFRTADYGCDQDNFCPAYVPIYFNQPHNATLSGPGSKEEYEIYIDRLNYDVNIKIETEYTGNVILRAYSGSFNLMIMKPNPQITITAGNPDRYVGPYLLLVKAPSQTPQDEKIKFTILVTMSSPTGGQYVHPRQKFDLSTFLTVFTMSMSFWMVLSLIAKRIRDRAFWARLAREQEAYLARRVPVKMYIMTLGIGDQFVIGDSERRKRIERRDSTVSKLRKGLSSFLLLLNPSGSREDVIGGSNESLGSAEHIDHIRGPVPNGQANSGTVQNGVAPSNQSGISNLFGRLLRRGPADKANLNKTSSYIELESGVANNMNLSNKKGKEKAVDSNSHDTKIKIVKTAECHDGPARQYPMSIEPIPPHPLVYNMPSLVATHFPIIFPDAEVYLKEGLLPPVAIGTTLHVDKGGEYSKSTSSNNSKNKKGGFLDKQNGLSSTKKTI